MCDMSMETPFDQLSLRHGGPSRVEHTRAKRDVSHDTLDDLRRFPIRIGHSGLHVSDNPDPWHDRERTSKYAHVEDGSSGCLSSTSDAGTHSVLCQSRTCLIMSWYPYRSGLKVSTTVGVESRRIG